MLSDFPRWGRGNGSSPSHFNGDGGSMRFDVGDLLVHAIFDFANSYRGRLSV